MRKKFRTLFISGLGEKKENHVLVPDLSVIITSRSLHPNDEARIWHVLLQKLGLVKSENVQNKNHKKTSC